MAISKVEHAYKSEKRTKEAIERQIHSSLFQDLQDITDASDGGSDENRLLPMMNKIWPYLVLCMKNRTSVVRFLVFLESFVALISYSYLYLNGNLFIYSLHLTFKI